MERIMKTLRFPKNLIEEIDSISLIKKTSFTDFITTAVRSYIDQLKFTESVAESAGAWSVKNHPELSDGTEKYVRKMRKGRQF
jgi:metal-responsive CopG/Arc/MetJ family transcriptional regulator